MAGRTPARKSSGANTQDKSSDGAYSKTTKTSYTVLRSQDNGLDTVDASVPTDSGSSTKAFVILGLIFLLALVALGVLYKGFPELDNDEYQYIKLPLDIEEAKNLGRVLSRYTDKYYYKVLLTYFMSYILYPLLKEKVTCFDSQLLALTLMRFFNRLIEKVTFGERNVEHRGRKYA